MATISRYLTSDERKATEAAGTAQATELAAARGIAVGSAVIRKGDTPRAAGRAGTGVVVSLSGQCGHTVRGCPNRRRWQCDYKTRPVVTVRWNAGQYFGGSQHDTLTTVALSRIEAI